MSGARMVWDRLRRRHPEETTALGVPARDHPREHRAPDHGWERGTNTWSASARAIVAAARDPHHRWQGRAGCPNTKGWTLRRARIHLVSTGSSSTRRTTPPPGVEVATITNASPATSGTFLVSLAPHFLAGSGESVPCRVERNVDRIRAARRPRRRAALLHLSWCRALSRPGAPHRRRGHEVARATATRTSARSDLTPEASTADIRLAKVILEDITGSAIPRALLDRRGQPVGTSTASRRARPSATARACIRSATTTTVSPTRRASVVPANGLVECRSPPCTCLDTQLARGWRFLPPVAYAPSRWQIARQCCRTVARRSSTSTLGNRSRAAACDRCHAAKDPLPGTTLTCSTRKPG